MTLLLRPPVDQSYLRVTLFIRAGANTATESHFYNSQSSDSSSINTQARNLAVNRMALAPTNVQLLRIRISVISRPRLITDITSSLAVPGLTGTQNLYVDSVVQTMNIVQGNASTPINKAARIFLAFPTDLAIQNNSYYTATGIPNDPAYDAARQAYVNYLFNASSSTPSSWGTLALNSALGSCPVMAITSIAIVAGQQTATVHANVPAGGGGTLNVNDVIKISRVPAVTPTNTVGAGPLNPWNQNFYVSAGPVALAPGPVTFQIALPWTTTLTGSAAPGGFATKQQETFWPYNGNGPIFAGRHKRGVRVFQPLGRQRIKRTVGY